MQLKRGWFIAAYVFAVFFFVVYEIINKDVMLNSLAGNLPAGTNSQVFFMANFLAAFAAFLYANGENRERILRSQAVYAFATTVLWTLAPVYMGVVGGYALFVLTGFYHIRLVDANKLFPFEKENSDLSKEQGKYYLWGAISLLTFVLEYGSL